MTKEKLESIKEALVSQIEATYQCMNNKYNCEEVIRTAESITKESKQALKDLEELREEQKEQQQVMDSEELVKKLDSQMLHNSVSSEIGLSIQEVEQRNQQGLSAVQYAEIAARAAIKTIRGGIKT